jgi:hypothetical protein
MVACSRESRNPKQSLGGKQYSSGKVHGIAAVGVVANSPCLVY